MTITPDTERDRAERLRKALRGAAQDSPWAHRPGRETAGAPRFTPAATARATSAAFLDDGDDDLFDNVPV